MPKLVAIEALPPAVALQQQRGTPSARSSVGSVTTLSSLVRMLYSRTRDSPPKQPIFVPDDSLTIRERAIATWPPAGHGRNLRNILMSLGYDVDKPWRDLRKKDRNWIPITEEQPTAPVYAGHTPQKNRAALRARMNRVTKEYSPV